MFDNIISLHQNLQICFCVIYFQHQNAKELNQETVMTVAVVQAQTLKTETVKTVTKNRKKLMYR